MIPETKMDAKLTKQRNRLYNEKFNKDFTRKLLITDKNIIKKLLNDDKDITEIWLKKLTKVTKEIDKKVSKNWH